MRNPVLILFMALSPLFVSCSKQGGEMVAPAGPECRTITLNASCGEAASKLMLNSELGTVWNSKDSVSVFYGGSSTHLRACYMGEDNAKTGPIVFTDTSRVNIGNTVAAVPYRSSNRLSDGILYSSIPSAQYYKEGSYDGAAALLAASSPDESLSFRYACAVLCVELKSYSSEPLKVKSITLSSIEGEFLCGNVAVDMSDPVAPRVSVVDKGRSSIVLSSPQMQDLMCTIPAEGSNKFYFCVAPASLKGGCRFDILLANGTVRTFRNTSLRQLEAGNLYSTRCGFTQMYSIMIDFDGNTSFNPSLPLSKTLTTAGGSSHSFTNPSDGNTYSICAYSESSGYYRTKVNGYYCLRFNGPGDYLKLPSLSGKKLARFGAMVRQSANYKPMGISSSKSDSGDIIPVKNYPSGEMTWTTVSDVAANTPLYLYLKENNTQISRIELYFE